MFQFLSPVTFYTKSELVDSLFYIPQHDGVVVLRNCLICVIVILLIYSLKINVSTCVVINDVTTRIQLTTFADSALSLKNNNLYIPLHYNVLIRFSIC